MIGSGKDWRRAGYSITAMRELARRALPRPVFDFADGGAEDERTLRRNEAAFASVDLVPRPLDGAAERDLTIELFGRPLDLAAMAGKLPWLMRMRRELPRITFGNYIRVGEASDIGSIARRMASMLDPGLSWPDVDWLRGLWEGPLLLKGVLHPAEAAACVAHGVDGLIVSNHGGRQLDGAPAPFDALPRIVAVVDGRIPVLLDGGVRRGSDVVKALALGARCCLIARPQLWGLAVAGEAGVAHVLDILRGEIDRVMGLMGVRRIADLGP